MWKSSDEANTAEPRYNEPLYNDVLDITNDFLYPSNSKIYEKEPRYNETSLERTNFGSPLALRYIEVPLYDVCFLNRGTGGTQHVCFTLDI